jgi:hypothetical protein
VLCLGYVPAGLEELTGARALVRAHVRAVALALGA